MRRLPLVGTARLDAILRPDAVAKWLKLNPRQLVRLGVPYLKFGPRSRRYLVRDVLAWLEKQRAAA